MPDDTTIEAMKAGVSRTLNSTEIRYLTRGTGGSIAFENFIDSVMSELIYQAVLDLRTVPGLQKALFGSYYIDLTARDLSPGTLQKKTFSYTEADSYRKVIASGFTALFGTECVSCHTCYSLSLVDLVNEFITRNLPENLKATALRPKFLLARSSDNQSWGYCAKPGCWPTCFCGAAASELEALKLLNHEEDSSVWCKLCKDRAKTIKDITPPARSKKILNLTSLLKGD